MTERMIPAASIATKEIQPNNTGEARRTARRLKKSFTTNTKNSAAIYTRFSLIVPNKRSVSYTHLDVYKRQPESGREPYAV